MLLLAGVEDGGQPVPNERHESPVVLEGGDFVGTELLLTGGGRVEAGSLLIGGDRVGAGPLLVEIEEGGQPMPDRRHESPVVLGGDD